MSDIPEKVQEVAADVVGEVADQAENVEQAIRSLSRVKIQFGLLGVAAGAAAGALVAFKVAYVKAETKYSKISDEEIAEMREHYQEKVRAFEASKQKEDLEELVAERGYKPEGEAPPMAVTPPAGLLDDADEVKEGPVPAAPPVKEEATVHNIFQDAEPTKTDWDYHEERRRRSPDRPYVIHTDERAEFEGYSDVTLTYYEADDVLCNERDEIVDPSERDKLVGEKNLERFGHGSEDPSIVYIRNDELEIVYEVVKSPNSFAEEVHGLRHGGYYTNLEKMRTRERDALDDEG